MESFPEWCRYSCGPHRCSIHPANADGAFGQQRGASSGMCSGFRSACCAIVRMRGPVEQAGGNNQLVIQPRRAAGNATARVGYDKHAAGLFRKLCWPTPNERSHSVRARSKNFR